MKLEGCSNKHNHLFAHCDCEIQQTLADQRKEFIDLIKQKPEQLMCREDVADNTMESVRFRAGYLNAIRELLKELEG